MGKTTSVLDKRHYKHDQLVALRLQTGKSLRKTATAVGISKSVLQRAESGEGVTYPNLCLIVNHYSVPVISLLNPAPVQ